MRHAGVDRRVEHRDADDDSARRATPTCVYAPECRSEKRRWTTRGSARNPLNVFLSRRICALCKPTATRRAQRRGGNKLKEVYDKEAKRQEWCRTKAPPAATKRLKLLGLFSRDAADDRALDWTIAFRYSTRRRRATSREQICARVAVLNTRDRW